MIIWKFSFHWITSLVLSVLLSVFFSACHYGDQADQFNQTAMSPNLSSTIAQPTPVILESPEILSPASLNSTLPGDVFEEIYYFTGGGGIPGDRFGSGGIPCDTWMNYRVPAPLVICYIRARNHGESAIIKVIGWQPNELIDIKIITPDRSSISSSNVADETGSLLFWDPHEWNAVHGTYQVVFAGKSGTAQYVYQVLPALGPEVYVFTNWKIYSTNNNKWPKSLEELPLKNLMPTPSKNGYEDSIETRDKLALYNFTPTEHVRILVYSPFNGSGQGKLVGWKSYQVNTRGELLIKLESSLFSEIGLGFQYAVMSEISGESRSCDFSIICYPTITSSVRKISPNATPLPWQLTPLTPEKLVLPVECPGAREPLIRIGNIAIVSTQKDPLRVRLEPGFFNKTIEMLQPGSLIPILNGPVCADNRWWWKVLTSQSQIGWVVEGWDEVDPSFILPRDW